MMYYLVRMVIFAIFIVIALAFFKAAVRTKIIAISALIICYLVVFLFPLENLFYGFQSPTAAFSYTRPYKVINVLETNDVTAILYRDRNISLRFATIKKDTKGWKISNPSFGESERSIFTTEYLLIYRRVNDNKLFVSVSIYEKPKEFTQVQSNEENEFSIYQDGDDSSDHMNIYYGFVSRNNGFYVVIDGKNIYLE